MHECDLHLSVSVEEPMKADLRLPRHETSSSNWRKCQKYGEEYRSFACPCLASLVYQRVPNSRTGRTCRTLVYKNLLGPSQRRGFFSFDCFVVLLVYKKHRFFSVQLIFIRSGYIPTLKDRMSGMAFGVLVTSGIQFPFKGPVDCEDILWICASYNLVPDGVLCALNRFMGIS